MAPHGSFYWNELMTHDPEKAKAFYASTIGWTFERTPMPNGGTYWLAKMDDTPEAGILPIEGELEGAPEQWFSYIAVDNVDARVKKAEQAGAKVIRPPFDVPGVGRIAILQEPGGAMIGWMKPLD